MDQLTVFDGTTDLSDDLDVTKVDVSVYLRVDNLARRVTMCSEVRKLPYVQPQQP